MKTLISDEREEGLVNWVVAQPDRQNLQIWHIAAQLCLISGYVLSMKQAKNWVTRTFKRRYGTLYPSKLMLKPMKAYLQFQIIYSANERKQLNLVFVHLKLKHCGSPQAQTKEQPSGNKRQVINCDMRGLWRSCIPRGVMLEFLDLWKSFIPRVTNINITSGQTPFIHCGKCNHCLYCVFTLHFSPSHLHSHEYLLQVFRIMFTLFSSAVRLPMLSL
jgi:hypothetical protein